MTKIKFKTEPYLFDVYVEFNQIVGMIIATLGESKMNKKSNIEKCFPNFVKMTDEVNKKVRKFAIAKKNGLRRKRILE